MKTTELAEATTSRIASLQEHHDSLREQERANWQRDRTTWLKKIFRTHDEINGLLRAKENEFSEYTTNSEIRDILFRIFYTRRLRVDGYFLLPLFPKDPKPDEPQLALSWFIPKAQVGLRIYYKNIGEFENMHDCAAVFLSVKSKKDKKFLQSQIQRESVRIPEKELSADVREWNIPFEGFARLATAAVKEGILKDIETLLDHLVITYGYGSGNAPTFSERTKHKEEDMHISMPPYDDGMSTRMKHAREGDLEDWLNDGYPDSQKICVDISTHGRQEKYVTRTLGYARKKCGKPSEIEPIRGQEYHFGRD